MYHRIINIGTGDVKNFRERRTIQLLNMISFLLFFIFIPLGIMNIVQGAPMAGILLFFSALLYLSNLYWNSIGKHTLAKLVFCYFIMLAPIINALLGGAVPPGQFIGQTIACVVFPLLAMLIFESKEEKVALNITIVFYFVYFISFDKLIVLIAKNEPQIDFIYENYVYFKFPALAAMIVIVLAMRLFKNIINTYETENEFFKEELAAQNEELLSMNEELNTMNEQLELRVQERTEALTKTNERIIKLSFITSHKLRGPLASILGITELFKMENGAESFKHILPQLHDKSREMDEVVKSMARELEKEQ